MKRFVFGSLLFALALSAGTAAAQSAAPPPAPATAHYTVDLAEPRYGPSAAVLLGFGTNDLNLGVAARGGYTLPNNIYIGGTIVYHFGHSDETTNGLGTTTTNGFHLVYLGPEGGYDLPAGPVLVRPYLGLGPAFAARSVSCSPASAACANSSNTDTHFAVWLGGTIFYPLGNFFVGGDLRALFVSNSNSIGIFATGGMNF